MDAPGGAAEAGRERAASEAETGQDTDGRTPASVPPPVPDTTSEPMAGTARPGNWRRRIPQVLALALVWVLLWGSLTPMAIIGGLIVGLLVTVIFPLPVLPERLPIRPLKLLRLIGFLIRDLVVSGVRVSSVTLLHGPRARSGIIGLPLCSSSDRTTTTIVAACALTPGSFTLQIDRRRRRWYVYALGLHRPGSVERVCSDMMLLQMRVIDAVGSDQDVQRCRTAMEAVTAGREPGRGPE
ncbi:MULTISPECIES: Na+/H+ antiporter subunit E [Pseudonocardia]|uniref:Na+/H+ antiporter subunit E n=1 Tax=Pseudonocardia TaxID=1847 RepID=UPI001061292E|nr:MULTISPECIES: Na+/H+ antiporter subunit E [Pseudonocardia]